MNHNDASPGTESTFVLRRSGHAPLRFQGELLTEADGHGHSGPAQNRWHELAVYRTAGGRYVASVSYRSRYQDESDHDRAAVCADVRAVADYLCGIDPTEFVRGFPDGEHYAEKQRRLMLDIRLRFEQLVSRVLDGDKFAEVVE